MKSLTRTIKATLIAMTILLCLQSPKSQAQVFTGGEFNVQFIGGIIVDIAPIVGYRVQNFSAGLSPVIMYTASGNTAGDVSYGARLFAEYSIYKGIFGHAEFQAMNTGYIDWTSGLKQRNWVMGAPVGVGYEREITNGVWFKTMVLYDVLIPLNLSQSSAFANPSVRGGITYQF
jgi:hypothetical protein